MRKFMRAAAGYGRCRQRYRPVTALSPLCNRPGGRWPPMSTTATTEETVMGQVIPRQHPAVVLKSNYKSVGALLAAALVATWALAAAVVILADDAGQKASSAPISHQQQGTRFDGGPDEGTRGLSTG